MLATLASDFASEKPRFGHSDVMVWGIFMFLEVSGLSFLPHWDHSAAFLPI